MSSTIHPNPEGVPQGRSRVLNPFSPRPKTSQRIIPTDGVANPRMTDEKFKLRLSCFFYPWYCHAIRGPYFLSSNPNGLHCIVSAQTRLVAADHTVVTLCNQTIVRIKWSRQLQIPRADNHLRRNTL
jgi:hypothetical protein